MKLYRIRLDDQYCDYYVIANSFNEAVKKILLFKENEKKEKKEGIFTDDGSLKPEFAYTSNTEIKPVAIRIIEMLTENVIS